MHLSLVHTDLGDGLAQADLSGGERSDYVSSG